MNIHRALSTALAISAFLAVVANGERGFVLTAPKVLKTGMVQYLALSLFGVENEGSVTVKLIVGGNRTVAESIIVAKSGHSHWVELFVPNVPYESAKLSIHGQFRDDENDLYIINKETKIHLQRKSFLTFIQTDKPIYKPGQTVNFRVFPVDIKLQPLESGTVGNIWIENPLKIRVEQWKDVSFKRGLIQLSLLLSEEAALGQWTIFSEILGKTEKQKFEVDKYVLPRFEVTATPPPYFLANAPTVTWKICAKYTYGKKVDGILYGNVTYYHGKQMRDYIMEEDDGYPLITFQKPISGCTDVVIETETSRYYGIIDEGLVLNAEVIENGTDASETVSSKVHLQWERLRIKFSPEQSKYYKPGLPYKGKVEVTTIDGIPATNETVAICFQTERVTCKNFTVNEAGHVYFTIPPQGHSFREIIIKAQVYDALTNDSHGTILRMPSAFLTLLEWYSVHSHYLQIESFDRKFACDGQEEVRVRYTPVTEIKVHHQIISRGQIVKQGVHQRTFSRAEEKDPWSYDTYIWDDRTRDSFNVLNGEFILKFDTQSFMSPTARLLVFYVHSSGEIIGDSRAFTLKNCLQNKVNLTFDQRQQFPGSDASLKINTDPHSVCGLTVVDKSVHLMKPNKKITIDKVFEALEEYDLNEFTNPVSLKYDFCERVGWWKADYFDEESFYGVDVRMAFEGAGMIVLSDFNLRARPCIERLSPVNLHGYRLQFGEKVPVPRRGVKSDPRPQAGILTIDIKKRLRPSPSETVSSTVRSYFPETWLWELQDTGESGEISLKRELPHTITEWVGNAICTNHHSGLGISDTASVITFKPFFVSLVLPYSVIRGEKVPIVVKVFNYLSYCLPIMLILETSEEFMVVDGSHMHKLCVCGSESETHRFMIQPNMLGNITLNVNAHPMDDGEICNGQDAVSISQSDAVSRKLLVLAEGFQQEDTQSVYFCPKEFSEDVFVKNITVSFPDNKIEGSESVYFSVTGDLMGPSLEGLQKLVRLPVGCGEQNMVLFTPNIFVLDYLNASNQLTDDVKFTILSNMKTGYQRELNYRHDDGSYSAFGKSDKTGSLWLTAFVIKSFSQARQFIEIDEHDLNLSTNWIRRQQLENGCFPSIGKVHHKEMKGGVDENQHSFTSLTAYTIISLLESGMNKSSQVIQNALSCMHLEHNPTSYSLALFAYASALAEDQLANIYLQQLMDKVAYKDGMMHWNLGNDSSSSINIEIGAYAILSHLHLGGRGNIAEALSIIKWLIQLRNSNGGFISTQDTVIALQAFAEYSKIIGHTNIDMAIFVEAEKLEKNLHLSEENKLVMQFVKVPILPTTLHITATGDGCALVQIHQKYNVEDIPASTSFKLGVISFESQQGKTITKICARYKGSQQASNMAVIEAGMISGYVPDELSLELLKKDEDLSLMRYEIDSNNVVFYFNELYNEEKCLDFVARQDIEVEDVKPAIVKLYDYYEQESFVAVNYTIVPSSNETQFEGCRDGLLAADSHAIPSEFCPLYFSTPPADFNSVYCESAFALKIHLRNATTRRMKIMFDFSPQLNRLEKISAFAKYSLHPSCFCLSDKNKKLKRGMQFFIIGKERFLWKSEPTQLVVLNNNVSVIEVPESMKLPHQLRKMQTKCKTM